MENKETGEAKFTYCSEVDGEQKVIFSIKLYGNESLPKANKSGHHSSSKSSSSRHKSSHHSSRRKSIYNSKGELIENTSYNESEFSQEDNEYSLSNKENDYSTSNESSSNRRSSSGSSSSRSRSSYSERSDSEKSDSERSDSERSDSNSQYQEYISSNENESMTDYESKHDSSKMSSRSHHSRHSNHDKGRDDHSRDKNKNEKHESKEKKQYKFDGTEDKVVVHNKQYVKINENNYRKGYTMTPEQIEEFRKNHTQKSLEDLQNYMNNIYFLNTNDGMNINFDEILESGREGKLTKDTLVSNDGVIHKSKSKLYIDKKGHIIDVSNINNMKIKFPHVKINQTVKKKIEYENMGKHTIEMQAVDENGNPIGPYQELLSNKKVICNYKNKY